MGENLIRVTMKNSLFLIEVIFVKADCFFVCKKKSASHIYQIGFRY